MVRLGNFFFRYRNALFPVVFVVALLAARPQYPFGRHDLDIVFDILGASLALLGQALRALTIGYEYIIRGGRNHQVYADNLVQGGVFAHCRNPLYVGNILMAFGLALMINSTALYLIVIPFMLIAYAAIVAAEEAYLRGKFGAEYDGYCERVNRWLPRWAGFRKSTEGMRFNWKRLLVKEFHTTFVLIAAIPTVELWEEYSLGGASRLPPKEYLIAAAIIWLTLYLAVRTLKKTGYVRG
jgi:protein-S-isoprenylcysteine O-methyltransferase Ste14